MQKELERFTNQARFVKMIIDNKLSISKKKKPVLIAELQKLNFKPFPKVQDASKAGELERTVQEEEEEEADNEGEIAANSYDYLLGMALWSLTQERVEKLMRQIGDKEEEIDALIKLSKEDIWRHDLDEFVAVWEEQLLEEKDQRKRVRGTKRRISSKLAMGEAAPGLKKRKALDDDDDFEVKPKKAAIQKKAREEKKTAQTNSLRDWLAAPPAEKPSTSSQVDGTLERDRVPAATAKTSLKPKAMKLTVPSDAEDSDEEIIGKPAARGARVAAQKSMKYTLSSDSDTDNGDDLLGDVSKMVKGIGTTNGDSSNESRALFSSSMSRPGSSAGLKPTAKPTKVPDFDADETDYSKLIPQQSPQRSLLVTSKDIRMTDDEDDEELAAPVAFIPKPKPLAKTSKAGKANGAGPKPTAKAAKPKKEAPKPPQLSPAAKAYAAKQAKSKKPALESDDDIDAMADDILDSPSSKGTSKAASSKPPVARPARRAAATKKKLTYMVDDESDEVESDQESSAMFSEDED